MNEPDSSAIYLSEDLMGLNSPSDLMTELNERAVSRIREAGTEVIKRRGDSLFHQGDEHTGVWIIQRGQVRTYYAGPSGKEITLAYWRHGHFVGGPEVFGTGRHVWSANIVEESCLLFLPGPVLKRLALDMPEVAVALIESLVSKGKAYSALIQMLGTRSVSERLQQLLLILVDHHSTQTDEGRVVDRTMTNEQIAGIVGATRQWVSQSFDNLQKKGVLSIDRKRIVVHHPESLRE